MYEQSELEFGKGDKSGEPDIWGAGRFDLAAFGDNKFLDGVPFLGGDSV